MNFIVYILVYPIIWLISNLPFKLLYLLSDFFYALVYHVFRYRKKVVLSNLRIAFPEKSKEELTHISKKSFHHFVDIFMEMIKSFTITKTEINNHYSYTNIDFLNELYKDGKSVALVGAHYGNWEWILNLNTFIKYKCIGAYTKVSNPYFSRAILKSRGKFGVHLVQTNKTIPIIIENHKNKVQAIYGLLSDQSPTLRKTYYWGNFFGVKVPIHTGAEMLAKKYNMNVVYMNVQKVKRGYYETTFDLITDDTKSFPNYEISDLIIKKAEGIITENPDFYMWTHKRFKHRINAPLK